MAEVAIVWMRIYEYPFIQLSHAFVGGVGCCWKARANVARMKKTIAPSSLDTCAECAKWLRAREVAPATIPAPPPTHIPIERK